MGQILELMPADAAGWMAVVAGMVAFALLLRLGQRREVRSVVVAPAAPARQLEPGSDWQRIMDGSLAEITRSPDLHSMQALAASQIDAAEHAFNRLIAECAEVRAPVVAPSFPLRQLAREPATAPVQQQPLAA